MAQHPHRVSTGVGQMRAIATDLADASMWSMGGDEAAATIQELTRLEAQVAELKLRTLTRIDQADLAGDTGATSTANWYAIATRTVRPAAHRAMRLATALDQHDATRDALAHGRVHVEQAEVILRALAELFDDLDAELVAQAERYLLEQAGSFDAKALKVLGRRILDVVAPEAADAHEARLLAKEEADAAAATRITIWDDGHGKTHGRFTVDTALTGAALRKTLYAYAAPKHQASQGPLGERRPTPERLGAAFAEMIQRYPAKRLPKAGGLNATVVVLMTLDTLMGGLKAAHLDTGDTISPALARRLACEAGIIPAVLDGKSQVLDLGRKQRFATGAQRIAKTITAGGCQIEGCDNPPGMTHLHHKTRWADGGQTNLTDLIMICPPHHSRAHDQRYQITQLPTGKYSFHRRT